MPDRHDAPTRLRRRAEARLAREPVAPLARPEDLQRLVHELQVHRIELEMQNEELQASLEGHVLSERRLKASDDRFRALSVLVDEAVVVHDNHEVLEANWAFAELVGQSDPEALIGKRGLDFIPFAPGSREVILAHIASGSQEPFLIGLLRRDGSERVVEGRFQTIDFGGRTARLVLLHDVSERTKAETEKRKAQDFLACVLATLADPVFVKDCQHRFVLVNDAFCAMAGQAREAILGREDRDFFPADQVEGYLNVDDDVLATGDQNTTEELVSYAGGDARTVVTRKTRYTDQEGNRFVVGIIRDITDRKRAECEKQESTARYVGLVNGTSDGVVTYRANADGSDFVFVDINPAGERLSVVKREEIIGKSVVVAFPSVKAIGLFDVFQRVWRTGVSEYLPAIHYRDNRIEQWVANSVFRLPSGEVATVYEDVTAQKQAEEQNKGFSHQLLVAREHERKRLAAALHHDLGCLAVSVSARLDAVREEVEAGGLRDAVDHVEACQAVLRASVARLKAIAVSLRPPDLELLGLTAALRQHLARVSTDCGFRIRFSDATAGLALSDDVAIALFRIGQEALTNAARHSRAKHVVLRLSAPKGRVRLSVRDDGCGFDASTHFQRPTEAIGLLSMREMARSLGGETTVESHPGKGTHVTATLPLRAGGWGQEDDE
jgi:PAS domain S-box-containing protein